MKCPICKGEGELELPRHALERHEMRAMAKVLIKEGYTYRQVMRLMGFHSPGSISKLIK